GTGRGRRRDHPPSRIAADPLPVGGCRTSAGQRAAGGFRRAARRHLGTAGGGPEGGAPASLRGGGALSIRPGGRTAAPGVAPAPGLGGAPPARLHAPYRL